MSTGHGFGCRLKGNPCVLVAGKTTIPWIPWIGKCGWQMCLYLFCIIMFNFFMCCDTTFKSWKSHRCTTCLLNLLTLLLTVVLGPRTPSSHWCPVKSKVSNQKSTRWSKASHKQTVFFASGCASKCGPPWLPLLTIHFLILIKIPFSKTRTECSPPAQSGCFGLIVFFASTHWTINLGSGSQDGWATK